MFKVGIIGYGKMGKTRHDAIDETGHAKVEIAYEPGRELENGFAKSSEDVINRNDLDCLFISTPNYLNKSLVIQGLQSGKHIFCEKPPTLTVEEMNEVLAVERVSGKTLMYGFNHRHHCSIKKIKEMVISEEYGKILWMRGRYGKSVDASYKDNWRSKPELAGGGILMDQGIHMLDLFLYLAGSFDKVNAFVSKLYWDLETEDNVFAIFKNSKTGIVASLHSTMTQWRHLFSIEVFLEKGYFVLNGLKTSSNSYGEEVLTIAKNRSKAPAATWQDEEKISFTADKSWASEVDHFFDAAKNNRKVTIGTPEEALELMQTLEKVYHSDDSYNPPHLN